MKIRKMNKNNLLRLLLIIFVITLVIIGAKNIVPQSKAEPEQTIQVTYKAGDGIGEEVTLTQTVYGKQTQGSYDYTDGKIIFSKNNENGINFIHDKKEVIINGITYNYDVLLSGWKLTSVTKNGQEITTFIQPENYNYTDKTNANKDIGITYAEEGWYIVPDGVTSITVEAVWGWAIYVKDPYNKMVYDANYWFDTEASVASGRTGASESNFGTNTTDDVVASIKRAYEIIYLAGESGASYDVYSHLIVLCGDLHDVRPSVSTIPDTTYADIDEDGNKVYDICSYNTSLANTKTAYQSYWGGCNRLEINATFTSDPSSNETYNLYQKCTQWGWDIYGGLRFDNIIYTLTEKVEGSSITLNATILYYKGTNYDLKFISTERFTTNNPNTSNELNNWSLLVYHNGRCNEFKVLGGRIRIATYDHPQNSNIDCGILKYILIGGNAYLDTYYGGTTSEMNPTYLKTIYDIPTLCITGGYIPSNIYLTGTSSVNYITLKNNSGLYLYMTDGYCTGTIYGSGGTPLTNGSVYINIENAVVKNLYGGGSKEEGIISGDVHISLKNMQIGISASSTGNCYGGPQYGNILGDTYLELDNVAVYGSVYGAGYGSNASNTKYVNGTTAFLSKDKSDIIALLEAGAATEPDYDNGLYYKITYVDGKLVYYPWNSRIDEILENSTKNLGFYEGDTTQVVVNDYISFSLALTNGYDVDYLILSSLSAATVNNAYTTITNSTITNNVFGGGNKGSVLGDTKLTITNSTIGGNIYGGGYSSDDTTVNIYTKPFTKENLGYAYMNNGVLAYKNPGYETYFVNGVSSGTKRYETFLWSNLEYLLKDSEDWTDEELNDYLKIAEQKGLDINGKPTVVKGIDYTNKLVYSANDGKLGTSYGNVIVDITGGTIKGNVYGGGLGGQVKGNTVTNITNVDLKNVYGGGYSGNVEGSSTVTINSGTINEVYGGGYSGTVGQDTEVIIKKGTFTNIFGGGDQSYILGNTTVNIGDEDNLGITVTGLAYGGGRGVDEDKDGDASDYITVCGSSHVNIQGTKTNVENYGSIKLGAVEGDVNVTFKDYWTGNATAKYKTMNGIDRATTVSFENSYVLLENKNATTGKLEGIKAIGNLIIPSGSGLKISADGEITGDFIGGGELYLDSAVCLTVGGDITIEENSSGATKLILNPQLFSDENINLIKGGIENPYIKVKGNSKATDEPTNEGLEVVSGERRYSIYAKKYRETDGTEYSYYYIEKDIIITDFVEIDSQSVVDKIYNGVVENENEISISNKGTFTTQLKLNYELLDDGVNPNKYMQFTRELMLKIDEETPVVIPKGTEIVMIKDGEYYTYIVEQDTTKVELTKFKNFTEMTNIKEAEGVRKEHNEITGSTTYRYSEEYRFIINFSNAETKMEAGTYYAMLNMKDNNIWIEEEQLESANIIQIKQRDYIYDYTLDREKYEGNGTIKIEGKLKLSEISNVNTKGDLLATVKLYNSTGNQINIPTGSIIDVNGKTYEITDGISQIGLLENITNSEISQNTKIVLDMSEVLPQYRIGAGEYKLVLELVMAENGIVRSTIQDEIEIPITIINYEGNFGIKTEVNSIEGIAIDKLQLINKEDNEERTINLQYTGILENPKVKITVLEKTGPFEYTSTNNSQNIIVNSGNAEITNLLETQNITVQFGDNIKEGTYRILFELYDMHGTKQSESLVNFIVIK